MMIRVRLDVSRLDYERRHCRRRSRCWGPLAIRLAVYGTLIAILVWIAFIVIVPLTIHHY